MLKSQRLFDYFRLAPVHQGILRTSLRQNPIRRTRSISHQVSPRRRNNLSFTRFYLPGRSNLSQQSWRQSPFRALRGRRHNSSQTPANPKVDNPPAASKSLSDRMKDMSRKYGWVVVGIYFGLSVLDFPFCFLAVRLFGTERIAGVEHAVIDGFWGLVETVVPSMKEKRRLKEAAVAMVDDNSAREGDGSAIAEPAAGQHHADASIWTQVLLAYGVHKSLIFIRVPVTLAITPKIAKTLRSWGWNVGKPAVKPAVKST